MRGCFQRSVGLVRVVDEIEGLGRVHLSVFPSGSNIGVEGPESTWNWRTSVPQEVKLGREAKAFARML